MLSLRKITGAKLMLFFVGITALGFVGCGGNGGSEVRLQGAGATFPNPLYQKWLSEYGKLNPNVKIDYQSIGSGGGIKQIQARTVDFGASDSPMKDDDLKAAPGEILHIPSVLGAVVITYNVAGVSKPLRFSPDVIADIFLGTIKKWSDPQLKTDNAGVTFPDADITVVHRSDGSGTSAVFTDYLSKVSPEWKEKVGSGTSLLFTAFGSRFFPRNLNQPIASLTVQIYNYAISPYDEWHAQAWAATLVLMTLILSINLVVRFLTRKKF